MQTLDPPCPQAIKGWGRLYKDALTVCSHGPRCKHGSLCQVGRRVESKHILTGSVLPYWASIQQVVGFDWAGADGSKRVRRVAVCLTLHRITHHPTYYTSAQRAARSAQRAVPTTQRTTPARSAQRAARSAPHPPHARPRASLLPHPHSTLTPPSLHTHSIPPLQVSRMKIVRVRITDENGVEQRLVGVEIAENKVKPSHPTRPQPTCPQPTCPQPTRP